MYNAQLSAAGMAARHVEEAIGRMLARNIEEAERKPIAATAEDRAWRQRAKCREGPVRAACAVHIGRSRTHAAHNRIVKQRRGLNRSASFCQASEEQPANPAPGSAPSRALAEDNRRSRCPGDYKHLRWSPEAVLKEAALRGKIALALRRSLRETASATLYAGIVESIFQDGRRRRRRQSCIIESERRDLSGIWHAVSGPSIIA